MRNNLPFQAVEIEDHNGFKAALYAINALYKRCGMECTDPEKARKSVSKIVKKATLENISLLLRDWYSMPVDKSELKNILPHLPVQISNDDYRRYENDSLVRGIEWSALATIFRCSIAVKIVSKDSYQSNCQERSGVEWKVAVPSPSIFGLSAKAIAGPATACVFILTHQGRTQKYFPLIPSNQFVFEPGKTLILNPDDLSTSKDSQAGKKDSKNLDDVKDGSSASVARVSSSLPQKRVNENKKKVEFLLEDASRPSNTDEKKQLQRPEKSSLNHEKHMQAAKKKGKNLLALTSRGFHPNSEMKFLKDDDVVMRSEIYTTVEKQGKERILKVSESSILLDTVYREAKRNEREISCLEIYDRVYHSEI